MRTMYQETIAELSRQIEAIWKHINRLPGMEIDSGGTPVTLAADADTVLSLTGQEIGLDIQAANRVFSGPTSGADADPTFRSLVADDIPSLTAGKISDFDTEVSNNVDVAANTAARHNAVTLAADADSVLGLSGQQINLDSQAANRVLAGPVSGADADPTFRSLVADDIPSLTAAQISDFDTEVSNNVDVAANTAARHDAVTLGADAGAILGLTGQQIDLDTQVANTIFAGPVSGADADPAFRALVVDDIPADIARDSEVSGAISSHAGDADAHHAGFIGLEDNAGTAIAPAADDRIQVTDDGIVNADASGNTLALSVAQGQIDHGSIGGLSDDDHPGYLLATGARAGASSQAQEFTNGVDINGAADGLILDADADTTISAPTDDEIDIEVGGNDIAEFKSGGLFLADGKDIYPSGDSRGLMRRLVSPPTLDVTDHFRSGVIPSGYTWAATSGVMNGTPTLLGYAENSDWLGSTGNAAGNRHFLNKAVANVAADWQNKIFEASVRAGGGCEAGIRIDNGDSASNQPYLEFFSDATAGNGTHTLKVRRRDTIGGGETVTTTAAVKPLDSPFFIRLLSFYSAPNYSLICYIRATDGQESALLATGALAWFPVAGRVGLYIKESAFYSMFDWFYTTF